MDECTGLEVDMSEYAPAFFENGFDSIKLLGNVEKEDLPGLIPKKGHHRLIQQALDDLKRKHRTAASSSRGGRRDRPMPKRRNPYSDEDSDDSFVVSDGDEYTPGVISGMFRKNRKRSYSFDSVDSYNMEASFDEIQHEEERRCVFHLRTFDAAADLALTLVWLLYRMTVRATASTRTLEKSSATRSS